MFNKQEKNSTGYVVDENFTQAILSSYSPETEYVPTDYRIFNHSYKAKFYKSLEERLTPIISKMDKHNSGKELRLSIPITSYVNLSNHHTKPLFDLLIVSY